MLAQHYPPDSPPLTPPGSTSTSDSSTESSNSNSDSTTASTTQPGPINPLYTQLHPPERKSRVIVQDQFDYSNPISSIKQQQLQQQSTLMATPLEGPQNASGGGGGVLLEEVRSPSTMTITPRSRSSQQHEQAPVHSSPDDDEGDGGNDGATSTKVSHDEKDHFKSKLHSIKLDAKEKLARVGLSHDTTNDSSVDVASGKNVVDAGVTNRLDRPLGMDSETETETEGEYLSGDETETENEASRRSGAPRLSRMETMDSQATSTYTSGDGGASFYSAESDLGGANSTVESLTHLDARRSESPVSFTVDGTSPPRLDSKSSTTATNGIDRYPVAYAPGYVPTNSRLVPVSSPSNRPSSPTARASSPSPKLSSSPRLSIPLPYVSSSSATPASPPHTSNRLVPTASIVKPSTSHPSLSHLSANQSQYSPQPQAQTSNNYVPPTRRASTTSPTLHPPPMSSFATSSPSRRGSSASTLMRPNSNVPQPSSSTSSFPQRSLSASQLNPSTSSATISQNLFPLPQHSSTYPPPLSSTTTPAQSPSLSRGLSQLAPSIHDDVESSIAAQAEQIRRQRLEKRQAAEAAERRLNEAHQEIGSSGKEKGKGREEESGGGIMRTPTMAMRRNSTQQQQQQPQQRHLSTSTSTRSRSGSGLGLGFGSASLAGGGGEGRESFDLQGGSALSTTSLALPLAPPMGTSSTPSASSLAPPVGLGKSPSVRSGSGSGFPHARSGSGGSSLLRERGGSVESSSPLAGGVSSTGRRSVSGESANSHKNQVVSPSASTAQQPPSSTSSASTVTQTPSSQPLARPHSSAGGLQRTHSQAPTVSYNNNNEKVIDGEKLEENTGGAGVPLVGNLIGTDHENYVLMYNMLTGIRIGVSRCQAKAARPLTDADYTARHKFSFDIVGNELTPSVRYDFKFKDYAPWVFRELREYFFLDPSDYLISLTAKYILSELGSPGKSGSFFYFSRDYRFIIKTIRHAEHKFLRKILKEYHEHVKKNPHTLLSRFYGLHRVKLPHGRKIHFVIMNNLFPPHRDIHETYDLKGSSVGRLYPEAKAAQNPHAVLKDLNWLLRHRQLELGPEKKALFEEQLRRDTELMQKLGIMDYSLLTGVHMANKGNEDRLREGKLSVFQPDAPKPTRKPTQIHRSADASALRAAVQRSDPQSITSGQDLPEHDTSTERRRFLFYQDEGGMRATGEANEDLGVIYYLGIIDILTPYTLVKRLEHFFKGIKNDKHCISAVPPREYGDRFLNFIRSCVRGNPQSLRPKMWMPPITEEEEQLHQGERSGMVELRGEKERDGIEREKVEEERGKEKVQ